MTNISQSFTYKVAAKINWHRYETKLTVIDIVETILKRSQDFRFVTTILPARRYASAGTSYVPVSVCLSVCLTQDGLLSKSTNGLMWFLAWRLLSTSPTLWF